jgi:RNA recognition motif-containing protein
MRIRISNIDTAWTNEDLTRFFSTYGEVLSAEVAIDVFTNRSRGFGEVEMADDEVARNTVKALDGTEVEGRKVEVAEAPPVSPHKGSYKVGDGAVKAYRFRK